MEDPLIKARREELHRLKGFYQSSLFIEFYNEIGIGGFRYMFNRSGVRRKVWVLVWFAALFSSIYFFRDAINDYAKYRTYMMYTETEIKEVGFPTINFCEYDTTMVTKLKSLNITADEFEKYLTESSTFHRKRSREFEQIKDKLRGSNVSTVLDLMNRTQRTMYDMLDRKAMMVRKFSTCHFYGKNCSASDFQIKSNWMPPGGYCSEFNSYKPGITNFKVTKTGIGNHFSVALDLHLKEMLDSSHPLGGLFIIIHPYGTPGNLLEYGSVFSAKPGFVNIFRITIEKRNLLTRPYATECGKKTLKIIKRYPYSKAICKVDCILQRVYQKCGCIGFEYKDFVDVKICDIEEYMCYVKERVIEKLDCECPIQCQSYNYKIIPSQLRIGSHHKFQQLARDFNLTVAEARNIIKKEILVAWFYVHDLSILEGVETPKMTMSNLLGTVGGNIGLFVSFSVVTIMEVLLFFWRYNKFKRQKIVRTMSYQKL